MLFAHWRLQFLHPAPQRSHTRTPGRLRLQQVFSTLYSSLTSRLRRIPYHEIAVKVDRISNCLAIRARECSQFPLRLNADDVFGFALGFDKFYEPRPQLTVDDPQHLHHFPRHRKQRTILRPVRRRRERKSDLALQRPPIMNVDREVYKNYRVCQREPALYQRPSSPAVDNPLFIGDNFVMLL